MSFFVRSSLILLRIPERQISQLSSSSKMSDEGSDRFEIERIVDKRYRNDRIEYLIKWRGYPDSQNTWEPSNNIEGEQESELLAEYEAFHKQPQQKSLNSGIRSNFNHLSPNKRRNEEIKKRPSGTSGVQSSNTSSGFDRGFEAEKVLGATDSAGELMLLVKWRHSDDADLVPARIVNVKCPGLVIDFYEQHSFWVRLPKVNQNDGSMAR